MVAIVAASTFGLAACGGGSSSSDVPVATSTTPATFVKVNQQMQAAIAQARPILARNGVNAPQSEFAAVAAAVKAAQSQWLGSGALPTSDDISALTESIQALATDFSASPVVTAQVSSDIGAYSSSATRYEQVSNATATNG